MNQAGHNANRAMFAAQAVLTHCEGDRDEFEQDYALTDLLCNLHHLADVRGLDWGRLLTSANNHYQEEVAPK